MHLIFYYLLISLDLVHAMEETVLSADNGRPSGTRDNEELTGEA